MRQPMHDLPPGWKQTPGLEGKGSHGTWRTYLVGYVIAIVLTLAAFALAPSKSMLPSGAEAALAVLALAQMLVHLIFFLHINTSPQSKTNILALAAAMTIIAIVVIGSLWIMSHLNSNMVPMDRLMDMQR
ncbi:cytochrome o ubiquinol oxidase subunit IV [Dyella soli]|uniref:Cytochrome bo(3) ubiquinol oxidase subunit 4 n=1 Tax=Dyella soli TaxID=522319 RepID=A0A4R0YMQ0_9GAMM|nr:cytochrome o ubiquinol oxidase subunit IV [Dyella soli]TCI10169.1 cytochrome o ubiquinol oxidase subunit IV [Dyella soli]